MIDPVVGLDWVRERGDRVVLADVRWYLDGRSGRAAYESGHLPGAVFVDLDRWLARHGSADGGRHPLPEPEVFAQGMAAVGIGDGDVVVGYDDAGGVVAARLVWMLRAIGHEAALLDGGLSAYEGELVRDEPDRPAGVFTARAWPADRLAGIDDAADGSAVVLDARDRARFRGDTEPIDPRAGHIPGARSLPCRENLADDGRFLAVPALRERFLSVGVTAGADVVSYCGSGVTACHNLLALEHAGLGVGRLYPGSWSQYSATSRPAATGDQ
ncbi:sulfurtransferase [Amorphoplanes digitatis]|uniref:Thiosulfate/3-mercaptopyruvate sulfurtransferase n=1 Tax=Actinoplanes digitatis TaxID=1868 RepID=A0A7W7MUG5_9ACTN|nr:sulfurtransferase [Actinoplanes digitatis]MBB4766579.1 thiosulfate/3-mercaptopyruvate sulfurtransferase [Actinoplanes digitatis]GID96975.1 sulfurtransferase [Actinoplanes digitatis]